MEDTQTGAMCIIMLKNVKRGRVQGSVPHTLVVNNAIKDTRLVSYPSSWERGTGLL